jgi:Tfp pilus assembly protein PilF
MPVAPVLPATDHFQAAMQFLQDGKPQRADEEFHVYLQMVPDSKSAQILVAQIETPLDMLFPADNFVVKLAKNDTLSSLAKVYLGDALQFYALARYNAISVPASVKEGQAIKIPKTPAAIVALTRKAPASKDPQAPASVGTGEKPSVDAYYQDGLIAFQRQDLDVAIANWDTVLAIDPNHRDAQLNRAQALQLKKNLMQLKR